MSEDRHDAPQERRDALDEQFEPPAGRPIATRTRVPTSLAPDDAAESAEPTNDREEPIDDEPVHPRTRVP